MTKQINNKHYVSLYTPLKHTHIHFDNFRDAGDAGRQLTRNQHYFVLMDYRIRIISIKIVLNLLDTINIGGYVHGNTNFLIIIGYPNRIIILDW